MFFGVMGKVEIRVFESCATHLGEFGKGPMQVDAELADWLVMHKLAERTKEKGTTADSPERRETAVAPERKKGKD